MIGLASLPAADAQKLACTDKITELLNITGSSALLESGKDVYIAITCPVEIPPAKMVPYFDNLRPDLLMQLTSPPAAILPNLTGVGKASEKAPGGKDHVIVGYYPSWGRYQRQYPPSKVDVSSLTHINYAFAKISAAGEVVEIDSYADPGNFEAFRSIKKQHEKLRTLVSIGGWTLSNNFSDTALSEESRTKFAQSAAKFMKDS